METAFILNHLDPGCFNGQGPGSVEPSRLEHFTCQRDNQVLVVIWFKEFSALLQIIFAKKLTFSRALAQLLIFKLSDFPTKNGEYDHIGAVHTRIA